jgi:hypothetical protein
MDTPVRGYVFRHTEVGRTIPASVIYGQQTLVFTDVKCDSNNYTLKSGNNRTKSACINSAKVSAFRVLPGCTRALNVLYLISYKVLTACSYEQQEESLFQRKEDFIIDKQEHENASPHPVQVGGEVSRKRPSEAEDKEGNLKKPRRGSLGAIADFLEEIIWLSYVREDGANITGRDLMAVLQATDIPMELLKSLDIHSAYMEKTTKVLNIPFAKGDGKQIALMRAILTNKRLYGLKNTVVPLQKMLLPGQKLEDINKPVSLQPLVWIGILADKLEILKMMQASGIVESLTPITNVTHTKERKCTTFKVWDPKVRLMAIQKGMNLNVVDTCLGPMAYPDYGDQYALELEGEEIGANNITAKAIQLWTIKLSEKIQVVCRFSMAIIRDPDYNTNLGRVLMCFENSEEAHLFQEKAKEYFMATESNMRIVPSGKRRPGYVKLKRDPISEEEEEPIIIPPPAESSRGRGIRGGRGRGKPRGRGK